MISFMQYSVYYFYNVYNVYKLNLQEFFLMFFHIVHIQEC